MKTLKTILCIAGSLFLFANVSLAQKSGDLTVAFETSGAANFKKNPITMEFATDIGLYTFDWLVVSIRGETAFMPLGGNSGSNYTMTETTGGGLLFDVWKTGYGTLQLTAFAGSTTGNSHWKYAYYSGGVYFNMRNAWVRPFFGLRVKYYDAHRGNDFDNQTKVLFSIGFRVF